MENLLTWGDDKVSSIQAVDEGVYDAWFRGKVQEALESTEPARTNADTMQRLRASIKE